MERNEVAVLFAWHKCLYNYLSDGACRACRACAGMCGKPIHDAPDSHFTFTSMRPTEAIYTRIYRMENVPLEIYVILTNVNTMIIICSGTLASLVTIIYMLLIWWWLALNPLSILILHVICFLWKTLVCRASLKLSPLDPMRLTRQPVVKRGSVYSMVIYVVDGIGV